MDLALRGGCSPGEEGKCVTNSNPRQKVTRALAAEGRVKGVGFGGGTLTSSLGDRMASRRGGTGTRLGAWVYSIEARRSPAR